MGLGWRTPSKEEFEELIEKCTWEKICTSDNINAFKVTASNGNFIIIPITGFYHRHSDTKNTNIKCFDHFYLSYLTSSVHVEYGLYKGVETYCCLQYLNKEYEVKKKQTEGQNKERLLNNLKSHSLVDPWNLRELSEDEIQKELAKANERIRQLEKDIRQFDQSEYELRKQYEEEYIKEINETWLKYPIEKGDLQFFTNAENCAFVIRPVKEKQMSDLS